MAACSKQYLLQYQIISWGVSMITAGWQQQKGQIARHGGRVPNPDSVPASGA